MKVVNLDKYRTEQKVALEGKEYIVRGITVGLYLNDSIDKLNEDGNIRGKVTAILDILTKSTDIPRPILERQSFEVLNALFFVAQGIDPEERMNKAEAGAEGGAEKNS